MRVWNYDPIARGLKRQRVIEVVERVAVRLEL